MASVYILQSPSLNKFYVGSCLEIEQRLLEHKNKKYPQAFTKITNDWLLFFEIPNLDKKLARKIETHIKAMKSKKYIIDLKHYPEMSRKLIAKYASSDK